MSLNIKKNGQLVKVAGSTVILDATASEIREGTYSVRCLGNSGANLAITFETPMPDTDYVVVFESNSPAAGEVGFRGKTTTGFNLFVLGGRADTTEYTFTGKYYAIRLVKLDGYTELQNKVNNPDSTPTENSTNLVTSGGVYDAISSASKIFINSESAWNELDAETKATYQVAIFTDKPNVNAVDSTNGTTTVVGEPNKRWVGTQNEWNNLTAAEKAEYEIVCFTDDNGASGKDIYSTTETKTNKVWINGKPIYRRVLTGFEIIGASGGWQTISGATIPNAGALVYAAILRNTSGVEFTHFLRFDAQILSTGEIRVLNLIGEISSPINTIILEYTKTTD